MESLVKKVRVALFGCGFWGKNLARNFSSLGALRLVCDPSVEALSSAKEIAPEVETNQDFMSAIGSPDIDAIVIATPAETHFRLASLALKSNKDVFVEKPLALEVKDALELQ